MGWQHKKIPGIKQQIPSTKEEGGPRITTQLDK